MRRALLVSMAVVFAFWASAPRPAEGQAPANSYSVTEIGFYNGINDSGHLAGEIYMEDGTYHASLTVDGVARDLGTLGGAYSSARRVNNLDQVVGWSTIWLEEGYHAFMWDPGTGVMTDLGTLGGSNSQAFAINDAGQVVGSSEVDDGRIRAFLWTDGQIVALPLPPGYSESGALGINASGQVVGYVYDGVAYRAFRWTPSVPNGTVGAVELLSGTANAIAFSINAAGDAVGQVGSGAVLWPGSGGPGALLPTGMASYARSINDSRVVVGTGGSAFVWDPVKGGHDLNRLTDSPLLGVWLDSADWVTADGKILAYRTEYGGYLLTPSPVPTYPRDLLDDGVGGLSLSWSACAGATSYNVKRWNGTEYDTVTSVSGTTYRNASIPNSEAGLYVVSAVNSYGQSANSIPAYSLPAPPTNLTASTGKGKGTISLKWTPSTGWGVTQYRIYRSTTSGGPYTLRATVGQVSSFADSGLASRAKYYYVVTAVNASWRESIYSNQASATTR